jgi:hypothetical protein
MACTRLEVHVGKTSARAAIGELSLIEGRDGLRVHFASDAKRAVLSAATLGPAGALGPSTPVETPYATLGNFLGPLVVRAGCSTVLVSSVVRSPGDHDLYVSGGDGHGFVAAEPLLPGAGVAAGHVIASGERGRFGVAWRQGVNDELAFAIVDDAGAVIRAAVIERDARANGIALVHVPGGWRVLFTPSPYSHRPGLVIHTLSEAGEPVSRKVLTKDAVLDPVAVWDGESIGVAMRWGYVVGRRGLLEGGVIGFLRIAPDGTIVAPLVAVDHPTTDVRPSSIVHRGGRYWLAEGIGWASPPAVDVHARIVQFDRAGANATGIDVPGNTSGRYIAIAPSGTSVRGAMVDAAGRLWGIEVGCAP